MLLGKVAEWLKATDCKARLLNDCTLDNFNNYSASWNDAGYT